MGSKGESEQNDNNVLVSERCCLAPATLSRRCVTDLTLCWRTPNSYSVSGFVENLTHVTINGALR